MPKKPNSHGDMQEYVPAGNGDASGEYGNSEGSNKHFTAFKKKKETRTKELSKKQIKEIGNYIDGYSLDTDEKKDRMIRSLRYYNGTFGDLSGYTDEDLRDVIDELKDLEKSDFPVYYKEGTKWKQTKNIGLLEKAGIDYYTLEERMVKEAEENRKIIEKSQNEADKEIQNIMGNGCTVCFGKGYSKEDLNQVVEDTKTYVNDFPELKTEVKLMGDRNNLEKLVNAMRKDTQPTEEEIQAKIEKLKKLYYFAGYSGEALEKKYREEAIKRLQQPIKIDQLRNAYAYWSPSDKAMIYMGKMKKLTDEQKDYEYKINFKSSDKRNGTYCHEMGHAVDYAMANKYKDISNKLKNSYVAGDAKHNTNIYEKEKELALAYQNFRNTIEDLSKQNYNKEFKAQYDKLMSEKLGTEYNPNGYNRNVYETETQVKQELGEKGIKKWNLSEYGNTNIKEFVAESFSAYYTNMNNPLANKVVEAFKDFSKKLREFE